jgi:hypothetical protein
MFLWLSLCPVVDQLNNRVLFFPTGTSSPTRIYGQSSTTTNMANTNSLGLNWPHGVVLDSGTAVWISDRHNHRVLNFVTGTSATKALGQGPSLNSGVENYPGGSVSASGMSYPAGLALNSAGGLYGQCCSVV